MSKEAQKEKHFERKKKQDKKVEQKSQLKRYSKSENVKISETYNSLFSSTFFCLNTHFYNVLQKKSYVILVQKFVQYRKVFKEIFGREIYEFIDLGAFLRQGWLCFDLNKFTKFAINKGYRRKLHECLEQWVKEKYGKKAKDMIEDIMFASIELAEENERTMDEEKILLKGEYLI